MIKFCIQQWDKNKNLLEADIRSNIEQYRSMDYERLFMKVVTLIFNESSDCNYNDEQFDVQNVTTINNGDWQGTLLFLVPRKTYQPNASDYLITTVDYGSCSGCDTLEAAQMYNGEQFVKDIMSLCLHLIQNTKKPYNDSWRHEPDFDEIEYTEPTE